MGARSLYAGENSKMNPLHEISHLDACRLCPRSCGANRLQKQTGFCGETAQIRLARAALHFWEEPCISGVNGSGAVFFCGCTLCCVFCQNAAISGGETGRIVSSERLGEIFCQLQEMGAHNINLVTPTQFVPQIASVLASLKQEPAKLKLPVVYNTGSYESLQTLRQMDGLADVYLPDLKYVSTELSGKYSHAADYFSVASAAIEEMVRQTGSPVFQETLTSSGPVSLMTRGVIVRHLVLPGHTKDSKKVIEYLYKTYGNTIYISIMNQYTPMPSMTAYPELNRRLTRREYDSVVDYAINLGVENAFIQEGDTAKESFIPPFDLTGL